MAAPGCFCPDDCGCRKPWRPNYCGCRAHDGQTHVRAETGSRVTVRRDDSGLTISGTSRGLTQEWEQLEKLIDARVQSRLATDRAYRNAENAEQQSEREEQITRQVERELGVNYEEG